MELNNNGLSVQCYLKPKILGKVRRRLQEMRSPSAHLSTMDLSHNESARLATDALIDSGLKAYQQMLVREDEADFLSIEEKDYILGNVKEPMMNSVEEEREEDMSISDSESSQTYFPVVSDSTPPLLDFGWPVAEWTYHLQGIPSMEVYFQSQNISMKDLVREFIRKAVTILAIVMDTFSDVEIFCDILETTRKRKVSVYILLEESNLSIFKEMCKNLQINKSHLTRMSVRSINGETYCAKSGKKFTGQVKEKFIIADCTQVLVGAYSFTWLSWQVNRSLAILFKGSSVKPFDIEFRRLYADSKPIPDFSEDSINCSLIPDFVESTNPAILTGANPKPDLKENANHLIQFRNPTSPTPPLISGLPIHQSSNTRQLQLRWLPQKNAIPRQAIAQRFCPGNFSTGNRLWNLQNYHYQGGLFPTTHWFRHSK